MEEQIREQMLLTPTANLASNGGSQPMAKRKAGGHGPTLTDQLEWELPTSLLPTPTRSDGMGGAGTTPKRKGGVNLRTAVTLLPTALASDMHNSRRSTARKDHWVSNPGTTPVDALWESTNRQSFGGKPSPVPPPSPLTNEDG